MGTNRPLQFTLRHMFLFMLLAAVLFAALYSLPDAWASAVLLILSKILTVVVALEIIHGRGRTRVFCIGAMFSVFPVVIVTGSFFVFLPFEAGDGNDSHFGETLSEWTDLLGEYSNVMRLSVSIGTIMALITGTAAVVTMRFLEKDD